MAEADSWETIKNINVLFWDFLFIPKLNFYLDLLKILLIFTKNTTYLLLSEELSTDSREITIVVTITLSSFHIFSPSLLYD